MVEALSLLAIAVGAVLLYAGAEVLVRGAAGLALGLGLRAATVGVTVVALATSTPELLVTLVGGLTVSTDIGFGNVVGSNVANIGLVLGLAALISPVAVERSALRRHVPFMLAGALLLPVLALDGQLGRLDGFVLLGLLVVFTVVLVRGEQGAPGDEEFTDAAREEGPRVRDAVAVLVGVVLLLAGSRLLIDGSVTVLRGLGVSDLVIGLTVVAIGTSLPELAAGVVGALRGHSEFVVGNVVGSNVYNILAVLGLLAVLVPVEVSETALRLELPALIVFTVVGIAMMVLRRDVDRWEGGVLVAGYVGFVVLAL